MTVWRKHIELKDLLSEEETDDVVRTSAAGFVERLKKLPEYQAQDDSQLEAIVTNFEDIADPEIPATSLSGRLPLCDYFNGILNALYDWADAERIWID